MRLLAVPNWSFGRNDRLVWEVRDRLLDAGVEVHYCAGDVDHNRTVTAFSGEAGQVCEALLGIARLILPTIDLNRHVGVHPRIGGLDVCPVIAAPDCDPEPYVSRLARQLAEKWDIPIFLYEHSEKGRHEADLPSLRKGGFGGLAGRELSPDFGPSRGHPLLGVTILGHRDFLLAVNIEFEAPDASLAKRLAKTARELRAEGDPRFLGVRSLGFYLPSRGVAQLSVNLTLPDLTSVDPLVLWAKKSGIVKPETVLIGVIRPQDLVGAELLRYEPSQVVVL